MAAYMNAIPAGDEDFDFDDDGFNFDDAYASATPFDDTSFTTKSKFTVGSPDAKEEIIDGMTTQKKQKRLPVRDKQGALLIADDLRTVILKGHLQEMKHFLQQGVPVDFKLRDGWTLLMYSASSGKAEIVKYLLENKADPNLASDLFTPLMAACSCSTASEDQILHCVKKLLEHGARINSHDRHFMTSLMFAAKSGYVSVVSHLIHCKCDINKQDDRRWTALCYAAGCGSVAVVKLLLDNKAKTNLRCSEGTPADVAYNNGHEKLSEVIEEHEHPEKHKMRNSIDAADGTDKIDVSKAADKYKRYGDLELFLFGMNLGHLIPVFQHQELDFTTVLQMTEGDLEKVGIKELGVRKKILKSLHEIHKKKWEPGSVRTPNSKILSCRESIDILENINKHISYISSTINYVRRNLQDHSSLVSEKVDNKLVERLSTETSDSLVKVKGLHTELKQLNRHVSEVTCNTDMVAADLVEAPESRRTLWMKRVVPSVLTLTVTMATIWMKPSHLSTALITATIVGLRPPPLISAGVVSWFFYWTTQTEPLTVDWLTSRFS
ncbi:ankyrin repeat, SAM and basic leucine zipper domain-containing protein 1-like [Antedon mediterranea]|uniref:ankyrin repeat, SAM and basic leucine zipper domain-containing protein 1-like n=1 Tax=Antedon mediterranea TaxID=105859 RepID=UPI003AF6604F